MQLIIDRSTPGNAIADALARWPRTAHGLRDSTWTPMSGGRRALASAFMREPAACEG